jgi:hypothetical protein
VRSATRDRASPTFNTLYTVDQKTGAFTAVGSTGVQPPNFFMDLAFDARGTMYGASMFGLFSIDRKDRNGHEIVDFVGGSAVMGLGYNAKQDKLYATDYKTPNSALCVVDTKNGFLMPMPPSVTPVARPCGVDALKRQRPMNPQHWLNVERLFHEALVLPHSAGPRSRRAPETRRSSATSDRCSMNPPPTTFSSSLRSIRRDRLQHTLRRSWDDGSAVNHCAYRRRQMVKCTERAMSSSVETSPSKCFRRRWRPTPPGSLASNARRRSLRR